MTYWFDVEDLITHFQTASRPTGIQRLTFEIYRELWQQGGPSGLVRFCRHGATASHYTAVDWPSLEAGILAASAGSGAEAAPASQPPERAEPASLRRETRALLFLARHLPVAIRLPLGVIYRSQKMSLSALVDLLRACARLLVAAGKRPTKIGEEIVALPGERAIFGPKDIFLALGASWGQQNAAAGLHVRAESGARLGVLVHDLVPELYPEWTSREGLPAYRGWLRNVVPQADFVYAVSRHTAEDLRRWMAARDLPLPSPVVLPVGYRPAPAGAASNPFGRSFVLFVSTIEVRKNHALLFRVWRRLLEAMPAAEVPLLVFAGKIGWLTDDLMVQMENAAWLNGHIRLIEAPTEAELASLYRCCAFTVFPSLYEGWGLPVTESLSFGKTVAASDRAAIPEAGGEFCVYFDPENLNDAYEAIRSLIVNPDRVRRLEARIRDEFRPPSWAETAAALLDHLREVSPAEPAGVKAAA